MLSDELLRPLVHRLVPHPIYEGKEVQALDLRSSVDLCPQHVWQRTHKHCFRVIAAHPIAELIKEMQPLVDVMIEVLDMFTCCKILELCSPRDLKQLVASGVLSVEFPP